MIAFYIILAASPVLILVAAVFFVLIVVGIRNGDHGDLAAPPRNRLDAITRRVAGVGTRSSGNEKGEH